MINNIKLINNKLQIIKQMNIKNDKFNKKYKNIYYQ